MIGQTFVLIFLLMVAGFATLDVSCEGNGEILLWETDTQLANKSQVKNVLFKGGQFDEEDKKEVENLIVKFRVDVVAPGSHLVEMMSLLSTKTEAMFFKDYDHYFKELQIGSTDRPMLLSYLGLQYATEDQINSWYQPYKSRLQRHIIRSCQSLINTRKESSTKNLNDRELDWLEGIKSKVENNFQLALLTFEKNLNLFMLDNYILLCSKLEPGKLIEDLKDIKLFI